MLKVHLWWHLREVSFFELARLVVDVDDGGDQGEGGQQKEEDGLDTKAGRGAARLVGLGLPRLGPVELYREHKVCFIGAVTAQVTIPLFKSLCSINYPKALAKGRQPCTRVGILGYTKASIHYS